MEVGEALKFLPMYLHVMEFVLVSEKLCTS